VQKPADYIASVTLDNNMTLIVDSMPAVAGVSIGFWFPIGSSHETLGQCGITHFLEHMLFKGSTKRTASDISRIIDRVGGYLNAFTERDTLCIHCTVPAVYFDEAIDVLLDMVYDPVFTQADFDKEKDIIRNEILSADDDIEESAHDNFFALMFPNDSLGRKIAGTVQDLDAFNLSALKQFYIGQIRNGSKILSIAGAVTFKDVISIIEKKILILTGENRDKLPSIDFVPAARTTMLKQQYFRNYIATPGSQIQFFSAIPLIRATSEWKTDDFWALSLASSAFGESMSSRLFLRLREEMGLCYNISSFVSFYQNAAHWGVNATTSPEQFLAFARAYLAEVRSLYDNGLSETEVSEAVTRMSGYLSLAADDVEYRMKRLARQYIFDKRVSRISEIQDLFASQQIFTTDVINGYIRQYCNPEHESILLYGNVRGKTQKLANQFFSACRARRQS